MLNHNTTEPENWPDSVECEECGAEIDGFGVSAEYVFCDYSCGESWREENVDENNND